MNEVKKENKMGTMSVGKLLWVMSWPAMLSMTIQALYNVVDSIFVAKISEDSLTAITLINPIQFLIIAVAVGTGIGINSLISRRLGGKRFEEANLAASNGFKLAFINWIIFAVLGVSMAKPFLSLFSEEQYIVSQGAIYLMIISAGSLFIMVQIIVEKIIQATGNMLLPMLSVITGAVINIILDPILIFGLLGAPKMGIAGAAIATLIGQCAGMIFSLAILFRKSGILRVNIKAKFNKTILKEIYAVGAPSILMQAILSFMLFFLNMILAAFSTTAVAVIGAYGRLQSFVFMPIFGINQGAMPVFGYNYGAENKERLMKAFRVAVKMAMSITFLGFLMFQILPYQLLSLFDATDTMYEIGVTAFRIISICFIPAAFGIISAGFFGATGHGFISLVGSVMRQILAILPLAYFFGQLWGVNAIWWAFPIAEILDVIYCTIMLRYVYTKEIKNL